MGSDGRQAAGLLVSLEDVMRQVCSFVAMELEIDPSDVTAEKRLREDLGADSVVILSLFDELSTRIQLDVDLRRVMKTARYRKISTVEDLCGVAVAILEGRFADGE